VTSERPKVLFYVQHLLGIGHLARASRICTALAEMGAAVTVVTGGLPVKGFPGPGANHLALPAVQTAGEGFTGLTDADGRPVTPAFEAARRDLLLGAFHRIAPDAVVTEAFPFGRRQMRFELLPLIAVAQAARPRPLLLCSLRDILQERTKPERDTETVTLVRAHFDRVLVHGDPIFAELADSFRLADQIADKVVHTGLVAAPTPTPSPDRFNIVVSAGGGAVGEGLSRAALAAAAELPARLRWCLITGPNLPEPAYRKLAAKADTLGPDRIALFRFRPDFPGLLASAGLSVSQAGYNTVCDILRAGCRAVLVPFAAGGETEQTVRSNRLARIGRAESLAEDALSGSALAASIRRALEAAAPPANQFALDGADRTAQLLLDMIARRHSDGR
jgi:predicted glycosyltransferase